jgi:hypothetical protein
MQDTPLPADANDQIQAQVIARERYFKLRDDLVRLRSDSEPDMRAIDSIIGKLEQAQLAYKASHGVLGNNPLNEGSVTSPQASANHDL